MATMLGESGAYRGVLDALERSHLYITRIEDLAPLRGTLQSQRDAAEAMAQAEHARIEGEHRQQWAAKEREVAAILASHAPAFEAELAAIAARVAEAEQDVAQVGSLLQNILPLRRLLRWFRARRSLFQQRGRLTAKRREIDHFARSVAAPLHNLSAILNHHLATRDQFIRYWVRSAEQQLACVARLIDEGQAAGAAAELEIIRILSALPDGWYVLSNVELAADRWIRFNGQNLRSAQLDHVVVGTGGVFVVETKNWSREFTEAGQYFDPYQQVARASYLCHNLLKQAGLPSKCRAIIATRSRLPTKPPDSYTKVLRPEEVCGYIRWFKAEIPQAEVERVVDFLTRQPMYRPVRQRLRRRR